MALPRPAVGDKVARWISAQPEPFQAVLTAGQTEQMFAAYRDQCPADVFQTFKRDSSGSQDCAGRPGLCMASCRAGQGSACFGLARTIELELEDEGEATLKFPFFMAACAAGHANGCTNAGATAKNGDGLGGTRVEVAATRACQVRTYEAACLADSPWGCFMLGLEWGVESVDGQTDIPKARAAWQRACQIDPVGGACDSASLRLESYPE